MAVRRLGKGLGALIPDIDDEQQSQSDRLKDVPVSKVRPNPFQPRETFDPIALEELKQSIAENGVIQPITVRISDNGYELIAGERRLRAVQQLELNSVPAFVMEVTTDREMMELSLIENIQRENLNPIDEARGYQALLEKCKLTQDDVAQKVGKERSTITNALRILKLPEVIQESVSKGELGAGHARALLSLAEKNEQIQLWKKIIQKQLSVRQVENLVKSAKASPKKSLPKESITVDPYIKETENKFRSLLGTQVKIYVNKDGSSGKIEIEYYSDTDIERILELIEK